jgi:trans-aconitate methyltransferase
MTTRTRRATNLIRLNLRVLGLAASRKWVNVAHVAAGYDRAAPHYDESWLSHLAPVTRRVAAMLPDTLPPGDLADLGCGTGFGVRLLADRYPGRAIHGCDVSSGMLEAARQRQPAASVRWHPADMLSYLRGMPDGSLAGVLAAWSTGYADRNAVAAECRRALAPGGALALVVNLADTLTVVRDAFRHALRECPDGVRLAVRTTFPRSGRAVRASLEGARLKVTVAETGWADACRPPLSEASLTEWLLSTGILAGYDAMLPLDRPGAARDAFEARLRADTRPIRHHYFAALATRP